MAYMQKPNFSANVTSWCSRNDSMCLLSNTIYITQWLFCGISEILHCFNVFAIVYYYRLTWIYFCRSGGTVKFTLPFMTNVTISISTSQILRSWVAIFQSRPPMAFLFRSLYDMPGFAPNIDVFFWGQRAFQISFPNKDTSRNARNRHWGSLMEETGILSNNMKLPSHEC